MNSLSTFISKIGVLISLFLFGSYSYAQEIKSSSSKYYYNNFDNGQLGTAFTHIGVNQALAVSATSALNNLTPENGYSLSSTGNGIAGGMKLSFLPEGTDLNSETYGYEWNFLYKNSGSNPNNSNTIDNGENAWKLWLFAENSDINNSRGYYLTHVNNQLQLRHKYSNSADVSQYNNLISVNLNSIGTNNSTYTIRIQRLKRSGQYVWHLFVDEYTPSTREAITERGGTGAYEGSLNLFANSTLLVSSTTEGRFKFDEFKFYSMKLEITGANNTSNGISNPLYAGQTQANLYGLEVKTRGLFDIYQMVFNLSGSITSIIEPNTMKLLRSNDNFFGNNDDYLIASLFFYDAAAQNYNMSDRFWSIGNSDGSNKTVGYYYIQANVKANPSTTSSYTFVGAPVLMSESAQINYVANGDVTNTVAPPVSSGVVYDWQGTTSVDWNTASNWSPSGVPGASDVARIGVVSFGNNNPLISSGTSEVGNVIFGTTKESILTINGILNVVSAVSVYNRPNNDFNVNINGSGKLKAQNIIVGNNIEGNTASSVPSLTVLNQNLQDVEISGALILNGSYIAISSSSRINNPNYIVKSGKNLILNELRSFHTNSNNISKLTLEGGNLKITGSEALKSISTIGKTFIVTPQNVNSNIEYSSSSPQTIYTNNVAIGEVLVSSNPTVGYSSIKFTGNGQKNVNSGILFVKGNWTSEQGKVNLSSNNVTVHFNGLAQTITDSNSDTGIGVVFKDVILSSGTKNLDGLGKFSISPNSRLNLESGSILNLNGKLTLKSDESGFASIATLNNATINGNANVEVFFKGGMGKRGTRMFAPPINEAGLRSAGRSFYQQMKEHMVITGSGGVTNGFDAGSALNPYSATIYKYKEDATASQSQFTPVTSLITGVVPNALPGEGFYFAYRGNRDNYYPQNSTESPKLFPDYVPESFSPAFTGTINQGNVSVTINNSNHAGDPNNGYNLVGNPYVSSIDWEQVYASNSNGLDNEIKIITPGGAIMTRKKVNGVVTVVNGNVENSNIIQPGQGFFIRKNTPGTSTFTFSESHKNSLSNVNRYLTLPTQRLLRDQLSMQTGPGSSISSELSSAIDFRIKISDVENSEETAIVFNEGFSENYDEIDASYLGGSTVNLASMTSDGKLTAINYMPKLGDINTIKLRTTATFPADTVNEVSLTLNFPNTYVLNNYKAVLKDNYLGKEINIRETPSYKFSVIRGVTNSSGNNRFELSFVADANPAVKLAGFEGKQIEEYLKLDWKTTSELSSKSFIIEHSLDGVNFSKVGELNATGDSFKEVSYNFNYLSPTEGKNHFRLQQVFYNNTNTYSDVILVNYVKSSNANIQNFEVSNLNNDIKLLWSLEDQSNIVKYEIEKSFNEILFNKIGEINLQTGLSYTYTDTNPIIGINSYRLKIIYSDQSFKYSEIRTLDFKAVLAIEGLSYKIENNEVQFSWKSLSDKFTDKYILEKMSEAGAYNVISEIGVKAGATDAYVYTISDLKPTQGKSNYRLRVSNIDKSSSYSSVVEVVFYLNSNIINLSATQLENEVKLGWSLINSAKSKLFNVERSINGGEFLSIGVINFDNNTNQNFTFADKTPVDGFLNYRIKHEFTDNTFTYSDNFGLNFKKPFESKINMFNVVQADKIVKINWSTLSELGTLKFGIEKSTDGVNFTELSQKAGSGNPNLSSSYIFEDLNPGFGLVYYRIKHYFTDNKFVYTETKSIVVKKIYEFYLSSFSVLQDKFNVVVLWETQKENGNSKIEIERSTNGVNFVKIDELDVLSRSEMVNSYLRKDLNPFEGNNYYRLKQLNEDGTSNYSEVKRINFVTPFVFNLTSFTIVKPTSTTAQLNFEIASERNGLKYEIERSIDGVNYQTIGQLLSQGNANNSRIYSYIDSDPLKDVAFYRIKYFNKAGDFLLSYPQIIDFGNLVTYGKLNLTVFPNPATDYIEINKSAISVKVIIYNMSGQVMKSSRFESGENIKMNISDLNNGIYIIELVNEKDNVVLGSSKFYKNLL
ncbi:T9SS type A sorting domain-containing protein [Pedobacter flavus]|uniref:T9SS type A sorting domain-containing protein n=1 Tax=Pedobacter flavus TaxID=3113906 RepID=A0ABU7GYJ3_9SPHI|nr:T9SS type A sorting domain-containing protein [Pedobacter sp. VNH31]MEE1883937.1 T9SS type A sorting domain-containing protein [Pedobacter sp. VNH31]